MRRFSSGMVTAIALLLASAPGCAVSDEDVQDTRSALEYGPHTIVPFNSAYTMTVNCGLIGIAASGSDGSDTGCGPSVAQTGTAAFIAGSTITATTQANTIDCRTWKSWTGACAGQGPTCHLPNVNSDVTIGATDAPLAGCDPK